MASEIKRRFTDTEMQIAKETDLPELLTHLGYQVRRIGRYHTTAEMDSLRIKDRRKWFRYSQNTGGDAITFLQQFCGKSFPEAVEYLLAFHGRARDSPDKAAPSVKRDEVQKPFALPPRNADDRRVFAYLHKRGIVPQVIRQFLNSGLLYEDAEHHNCVFVGKNSAGQAKYAALRGTYDREGKGFRGDVTGRPICRRRKKSRRKDRGRKRPCPSHKCPQCGHFQGFVTGDRGTLLSGVCTLWNALSSTFLSVFKGFHRRSTGPMPRF